MQDVLTLLNATEELTESSHIHTYIYIIYIYVHTHKYDVQTLLNATEELAAIPGIKEHAAMAKLCAARTLMFKAWRVMYLGVSYLAIQRFAQVPGSFECIQGSFVCLQGSKEPCIHFGRAKISWNR